MLLKPSVVCVLLFIKDVINAVQHLHLLYASAKVGMIFSRKDPMSFFDLIERGEVFEPENLVKVCL